MKGLALLPVPEQDALVDSYKPEGANFAAEADRYDAIRKFRDELRQGALKDTAEAATRGEAGPLTDADIVRAFGDQAGGDMVKQLGADRQLAGDVRRIATLSPASRMPR